MVGPAELLTQVILRRMLMRRREQRRVTL